MPNNNLEDALVNFMLSYPEVAEVLYEGVDDRSRIEPDTYEIVSEALKRYRSLCIGRPSQTSV